MSLTQLLTPGEVYELRALNVREGGFTVRAVSGYFDDLEEMERQAALIESQGASGIYYTPNPVDASCLARAANRVVRAKVTTNDREIERRRWLLVDLDPVRPAGVSASEEEHEQAMQRARVLRDALDWPRPVLASSGNGAHLMWRVDLPNDEDTAKLFSRVLDALDRRFSTPEVSVDTTVFNAARIWKVPGTTARKGDEVGDRVHRRAEIFELGDEALVTRAMLVGLAGEEEVRQASGVPRADFDLSAFLRKHFPAAEARPWNATGGLKWILDPCPFNPDHTDRSAFVTQRPSGEIAAGCQHNSCSWDWHDLKQRCEPVQSVHVDYAALLSTDSANDDWESMLIRREEKVLKRTENATLYLEHHPEVIGCFGYNEMLGRTVVLRPPRWPEERRAGFTAGATVEDHHETEIVAWLERVAGHSYPQGTVHAALARVARRAASFHPVRDYLEGLRWDGTPRLSALFWGYFGAERSEYTEKVAAWWMISAVARAYEPGCQADSMVVLEGDQGRGKSSSLRILAGDWFSDTAIPFGTKEAYQQLEGVWIYEIAELDGMDYRSVETIKAFVTARVDRFRAAYGRNSSTRPRTLVFAGTTNRSNYLRDASGNRRFWPVTCGYIDREALAADRDQLWAEAVTRHKRGEQWWPMGADVELCAAEAAARMEKDPWASTIHRWLVANPRDWASSEELLTQALDIDAARQNTGHARRLAEVMSELGWEKSRKRRGGRKERGFSPVREDDTVPF